MRTDPEDHPTQPPTSTDDAAASAFEEAIATLGEWRARMGQILELCAEREGQEA